MQRDTKITLFVAVFISLAALALLLSLVTEAQGKIGSTKTYLVPGSYQGILDHGFLVFAFVIDNAERQDRVFFVEYLLGESVIGSETIIVSPGSTTYERHIQSRFRDPIVPVPFTIRLRTDTQRKYTLSYWVKALDYR